MFNSIIKKILLVLLCICGISCFARFTAVRRDTSDDLITKEVAETGKLDYRKTTESIQRGLSDYQNKESQAESENAMAAKEIFLDEIPSHMFFLGDDKMLIWGDNTVLLDLNSMEIIKKASNEELGFSPYQFTKCNLISDGEGYTFAGIVRDTKESITYLALLQYDKELRIKQFINLEKVIGARREVMAYKFSDDGTKLLYSTINGFYLYDFDTKETNMLYGEGMVVDNCGFFSDNGQILFTGDKNNGNVVFDRVFGSIDVNTNELTINEKQHLWGELWCFEDLTLIEEADVYNKENERIVFAYNEMGELKMYPLVDESENFHIYPSQEGHYYATRSRAPEGGYIIRIYGAEEGRLEREISLTYEEYGTGIRLLNILICEERNQIILLVQGWGDKAEGACLVMIDM